MNLLIRKSIIPICRYQINRNLYTNSHLQVPNVVTKLKDFFNVGETGTGALMRTSIFHYQACSDKLNVETFFDTFKLPDSLFSFYLVVQMHVWMCQARSMQEADKRVGKKLRNEIVARMWTDFEDRIKKMDVHSPKIKSQIMEDLLFHHQGAMMSYDSGLIDDKTLACALWRTLFSKDKVDPRVIELAVRYVRTQVAHIRSIDSRYWCTNGRFDWAPFNPIEYKPINSS